MTGSDRLRSWVLTLAAVLAAGVPGGATSQTPPAPASPPQLPPGVISGVVIDAQSREPLDAVSVTLEAVGGAAFPPARDGSGFLRRTLTSATNARGEYWFSNIPAGDYRLHVQRVGYQSASAEVVFRGTAGSRVSFGLELAPVALQQIDIAAASATQPVVPNASRLDPSSVDQKRAEAERARQEAYLSGDVRVVTHADVTDAVTLGETDLFRAMQRLPGVSTGDEYSAELWTRGARWDHTLVYFDGLPLFNPLHAAGVFTAVNADALGAALLHPGLQPAHVSGGAAATIELRSRAAELHPEHNTLAEVSLVSARATTEWRRRDARFGGLLSLRRTYLDWLTSAIEQVSGADDVHVPYRFWDSVIRLDYQVDDTKSLEFSHLMGLDELRGDVPDVLERTRATWGGGATRLTYNTPWFGLRSRHTIGLSGFGSTITRMLDADSALSTDAAPGRAANSSLYYVTLLGDVQSETSAAWAAGYELTTQKLGYTGPRPGPLEPTPTWSNLLHLDVTSVHGALWGQRRWLLAPELALETGLRLEIGESLDDAPVRLAPRLSARYRVDPRLSLFASYGRHQQYTQAIAGVGIRPVNGMQAEYIWLPAGADMPVLRSDVAAVGAERWLGNDWLAGVTLHARFADRVNLPDPTPGNLLDRPLYVLGRNTAHGADVSVRRLTGRLTGSLAYAYSRSDMEVDSLRFPAPTDRRHVFDATAQLRLTKRWLLGAAYTAATGSPYTRTFMGHVTCDTNGENCRWLDEPWVGEPGAFRSRAYQSLDLLAEWTRDFGGWQGGFFLQLRNALNHSNQGRYAGFEPLAGENGRDEFLQGAPMLPVIGFRFAF